MELAAALRRRRMVRRFVPDQAVAPDVVAAVVDAAVRAPTAGFTQGVSYQVLDGADVAAFWSVAAAGREPDAWQRGLRSAPVLILVWTSEADYLDRYARPDKGWHDRDPDRFSAPYWWVDAGMGTMAALLVAVDRGLGACFFGVPADRQTAVRDRFGVPAAQACVGVIALGHPADDRPARRRARRGVVHHGRWSTTE